MKSCEQVTMYMEYIFSTSVLWNWSCKSSRWEILSWKDTWKALSFDLLEYVGTMGNLVDSPHKGPVKWNEFPCHCIIMYVNLLIIMYDSQQLILSSIDHISCVAFDCCTRQIKDSTTSWHVRTLSCQKNHLVELLPKYHIKVFGYWHIQLGIKIRSWKQKGYNCCHIHMRKR